MNVTFTLTCPRCGGDVRHVANDDPTGWVHRERRMVVQCQKTYCAHTAVVHAELVDLTYRRNVA